MSAQRAIFLSYASEDAAAARRICSALRASGTDPAERVSQRRATASALPARRKSFWLIDLRTGAERMLAELPAEFVIGNFDVSPDGSEILFERVQENPELALIERSTLIR